MARIYPVISKLRLRADAPPHIRQWFKDVCDGESPDEPKELATDDKDPTLFSLLTGRCGCYEFWDERPKYVENEDGTLEVTAQASRKRLHPELVQEILTLLLPYLVYKVGDILAVVSDEDWPGVNVMTISPDETLINVEIPRYYSDDHGFITDSNHPKHFSGEYKEPWTYLEFYERHKAHAVGQMVDGYGF